MNNPHLRYHAVVKMLLNEAKYELKGNAIAHASQALAWFNSLEPLLKELHAREIAPCEDNVSPIGGDKEE